VPALSPAQRAFYWGIGVLTRAALPWMFSRVEVRGAERIPEGCACILSPNHVNAFLDAFLVGMLAPTGITYLSRASVFGTRLDWFLEALHMMPIYRRRDGYANLARNHALFARLRERLARGEAALIFSEGEHAPTYHLRPLTRGSARFALETHAALGEEVLVVPIGLNYYHLHRPGFKVSVVVGEPLAASAYAPAYDAHAAAGINALRAELTTRMQACLLLPEQTDDHHARLAYVNRRNEHLPFPAMKRALAALGAEDADDRNDAPRLAPRPPYRPALDRLGAWLDALNAPPVLLAGWAMGRVADPAFAASLKFAAGMLVLPLWWLLLFALGALAAGPLAGAGLALAAVATLFARRACIRHADPPHRVRG
jgi:1-acyl-sn-glycerol-3-phosphate acyltransferase